MLNLFLILFFLLLMIILMVLNYLISKKMFKNREKMSSFECGFDSFSMNRLPFSLQFFLISVIFLIFDIEIALILPLIFMDMYLYYFMLMNFFTILLILLFGLYCEWMEGALKWFK